MYKINTSNIGMLTLAIYLILLGLINILGLVLPAIILGVLALVSGICLLIGR